MPDDARPRKLEDAFLVVQDAFRSETVEYADVVLPAATWGSPTGRRPTWSGPSPGFGPRRRPPPRPDGPRVDRRPRRSYRPRSVRSDTGARSGLRRVCGADSRHPADLRDQLRAPRGRTRGSLAGTGTGRVGGVPVLRGPGMAATSRRVTSATSRQRTIPASERPTTAMRSTARPIPAARPTNRGRSTPSPAARGSRRVRPGRFPSRPTSPIRSRADHCTPPGRVQYRGPDPRGRTADGAGQPGDGRRDRGRTRGPADGHVSDEADEGDEDRQYGRVVSRRASVTVCVETDEAIPDGVVWLPIHHPPT